MYSYEYPRPALTVDCVVFGVQDGELKILLIQRKDDPFRGMWAIPGGFVEMTETTEEAARRELKEETSLNVTFMEQLYTFSGVDRDPRERVVSVAYYALVKPQKVTAGSDASNAQWLSAAELPALAFDHKDIVRVAIERLKGKIRYQPVGFELLPKKFSLSQLQQLYEAILERHIDKRNFRKAILRLGILEEVDIETGTAYRPAKLYRFDRAAYRRLTRAGVNFEI